MNLDLLLQFDAILFDLDGVLTKTQVLHAKAWKMLFDEFLKEESFSIEKDYARYIDGKPRQDGIRSFLASRNIVVDESELKLLGEKKNRLFHVLLDSEGVEVYPGSFVLLQVLQKKRVVMGCVSSSKNCKEILKKSALISFFSTIVDGNMRAEKRLRGKPAPDTYLYAAKLLKVLPEKVVVFEDALSGITAAKSGNFGLVVAVDRLGQKEALKKRGADFVIKDLEECAR